VAELIGGDKLNAVLNDIAQRLGRATEAQIGFMDGAKYPDGTQVAMVAAINNFGAPEANIPARPFFSNMIQQKSSGWGDRLSRILVGADYDARLAMHRMAYSVASDLQQSIIETNEPALSPVTITAKGFAKPLIDTAHMINSVQYNVDGDLRSMPSKGGGK